MHVWQNLCRSDTMFCSKCISCLTFVVFFCINNAIKKQLDLLHYVLDFVLVKKDRVTNNLHLFMEALSFLCMAAFFVVECLLLPKIARTTLCLSALNTLLIHDSMHHMTV